MALGFKMSPSSKVRRKEPSIWDTSIAPTRDTRRTLGSGRGQTILTDSGLSLKRTINHFHRKMGYAPSR